MKSDPYASMLGLARNTAAIERFVAGLGVTPELDEYGDLTIHHFAKAGASLYFDKQDRLTTIFFYSGLSQDAYRYVGTLPLMTSFEHGRGDAVLRFGRPHKTGEKWDRFAWCGHWLHLTYSDDGLYTDIICVFERKYEKM